MRDWMPNFCRSAAGPIPLSIRILGVLRAPALRISSPRGRSCDEKKATCRNSLERVVFEPREAGPFPKQDVSD